MIPAVVEEELLKAPTSSSRNDLDYFHVTRLDHFHSHLEQMHRKYKKCPTIWHGFHSMSVLRNILKEKICSYIFLIYNNIRCIKYIP
jgi:hypothetical protein